MTRIRASLKFACLTLLGLVPLPSLPLYAAPVDLKKDVPWEELSDQAVSRDWGRKTLDLLADEEWKHGESDHFVIHYTAKASRIARLAEESYEEIFEFFGNPSDRMEGRKSHIYAIHDGNDWNRFKKEIARMEWIGAVCRGHEFWFPSQGPGGDFDIKGKTLNHEMTHLVINRFLRHRIPLWLNEGLAEYFGARRILGKRGFKRTMGTTAPIPLKKLLTYSTEYPTSDTLRHAFYNESAILLDFLTGDFDHKKMIELVDQCDARSDATRILPAVYGFDSLEAFDQEYQKHRRRF